MMEFTSKIKFEDERTHTTGEFELKWKIDFEVRSWGLKAIEVIVPDQIMKVDGSNEDPESGEETPVSSREDLKIISSTGTSKAEDQYSPLWFVGTSSAGVTERKSRAGSLSSGNKVLLTFIRKGG